MGIILLSIFMTARSTISTHQRQKLDDESVGHAHAWKTEVGYPNCAAHKVLGDKIG